MRFATDTRVIFRLPAETRTNGDGLQVDPEMVFVTISPSRTPTPTDVAVPPEAPQQRPATPKPGMLARFNAYRRRRHRGGKV